METGGSLRLADVFVSIDDPRQAAKVEHDLVELLVVAVNAVLVGADTAFPRTTPLAGCSVLSIPISSRPPSGAGSVAFCPPWARRLISLDFSAVARWPSTSPAPAELALAARLQSCPVTKPRSESFSATYEVVP